MKKVILFLVVIVFVSCNSNSNDRILEDIEGNTYNTKLYGNKLWMIENLKVKKDNNGNEILFYYPNQDSSLVDTFGLLYNYKTATTIKA